MPKDPISCHDSCKAGLPNPRGWKRDNAREHSIVQRCPRGFQHALSRGLRTEQDLTSRRPCLVVFSEAKLPWKEPMKLICRVAGLHCQSNHRTPTVYYSRLQTEPNVPKLLEIVHPYRPDSAPPNFTCFEEKPPVALTSLPSALCAYLFRSWDGTHADHLFQID